jgi:TPR repeat protein
MAMPLGSIEDALQEDVEFTEVQLLKLIFGVAVAMQYMHAHNVIHRDLKPENIFLNEAREPVVGDFGLSKLLGPDVTGFDLIDASRDVGTPIYSAPEILTDDMYTKKSDVYSYGLVIYRVVSRERPFRAITRRADLVEAVSSGVRPALADGLPERYRDLIAACWAPCESERPSFASIVHRITHDEFPGAGDADFEAYRARVTSHAVTGRVLQLDLLNFSAQPLCLSPRARPLALSEELAIVDGAVCHADGDGESLDLPPEDELKFLSSRPIVPGGYAAPHSPVAHRTSRKVLVPFLNPIAFQVTRSPSTPTGTRPVITDLVCPAASELALKARADKGDREAQVFYAKQLRDGRSYAEAADYWEKAADAGAALAQYYYADALRCGLGVIVDIPKAMGYYKRAADGGVKEAMYYYGLLCRKDNEAESDKYLHTAMIHKCKAAQRWFGQQEQRKGNDAKAFPYFRQAAEQGDVESQYLYGEMLRDGRGTPKNLQEAERYLRLAAAHDHGAALFALSMLIKTVSPDESRSLLERALRLHNRDACFHVGQQMLRDGQEAEGLRLVQEAADRAHTDAMATYAIYQLDHGSNAPETIELLERAANKGSISAVVRYAELMLPENEARAIECFKRAAERGDTRGQYFYGKHLLKQGSIVEGNDLLRKAITQGCTDAVWALTESAKLEDADAERMFDLVKGRLDVVHEEAQKSHPYAMYWMARATGDREMLRQAAEKEVPQAQSDYAFAIQKDSPGESDRLLRSALGKSSTAQLWFARIHLANGNKQRGKALLRRAACQGNPEAEFELGKGLFGQGIPQTEADEALSFLRKAATSGYPPAMYFLGKYLVSIGDENGQVYISEAKARGYVVEEGQIEASS